MESLISVVVPVYNVENYVERCINSIIAQTYKNIEIIIVDDGSTDNSGHIVDEISLKDQRIKVIHQENGGLSAARNTGIDKAIGEYLVFVDSDDYICSEMIEVLFKNMMEYNADVSVCDYFWIREGEDASDNGSNKTICYDKSNILNRINIDARRTVVAWNKIYKSVIFSELRYPVGKLQEDEFIIHEVLSKCSRIVYTDRKLYCYMIHENSIMGQKSTKSAFDGLEAVCNRMVWASTHGNKQFVNGCFDVVLNVANCMLDSNELADYDQYALEVKKRVLTAIKSLKLKSISIRKLLVGYCWSKDREASGRLRHMLHC